MKIGFRVAVILLLVSNPLFCQNDSILTQVIEYQDSKSTIISKGRALLLDKFLEGDLNTVRDIKDLLVKTEDDNYIAFFPSEYWFVLYWTRDYDELAENIQSLDSAKLAGYKTRIRPLSDKLFEKLEDKSFKEEQHLKMLIMDSDADPETKQILILNLENLLVEKREDIFAQDSINIKADEFLASYPTGKYEDFTRKYIRYKMVPKDWGLTFEFFTGYAILGGALGDNYSNNVPIGVAFDVCYRNFELYLRDYIGFSKTKVDLGYSLGTFEKGSGTLAYLPEASLGYVVHNDNRFKISPFAGIGALNICPAENYTDKTPELEEVSLDFTTTYIAGINLDIKFGPKNTPAFWPVTSYGYIRIRYGYCMPRFEKKYDGIDGGMHYITIGFGGMGRGVKRDF